MTERSLDCAILKIRGLRKKTRMDLIPSGKMPYGRTCNQQVSIHALRAQRISTQLIDARFKRR